MEKLSKTAVFIVLFQVAASLIYAPLNLKDLHHQIEM